MSNRLRVMTAKFLIPRANCLRVVSERIKKSLLRVTHYPLRVTTLSIFVDTEKIRNATIKTNLRQKYPQFDFIILMASRFSKEKNIGLAIEAIKEINNKKIGLIIAGEGPEKENYKLSDNIILEPWTNDLASYYKTADLFVFTSDYEGYGMVLIEAAAAGCKIISTDVGVAGEILDWENIVKVGDKEGLKDKIEKAVKGEIKPCLALKTISKEKYLEDYKKSLETCAS
jgi:glycosyltransferase involved in cell wall biosynthesis